MSRLDPGLLLPVSEVPDSRMLDPETFDGLERALTDASPDRAKSSPKGVARLGGHGRPEPRSGRAKIAPDPVRYLKIACQLSCHIAVLGA